MSADNYVAERQALGEDLSWYEVRRAFDAGVVRGVGIAIRTHTKPSFWQRFKYWLENPLNKDKYEISKRTTRHN